MKKNKERKIMRQLTEEEKRICMKALDSRKDDLEWLAYQVMYYELMLKKGLEINYKKTLREFKQKKKEYENEFNAVNNIINQLQDQIRNGVEYTDEEIKKDVGEEGDEENGKGGK